MQSKRSRLKVKKREHENVVGLLCMLLITLTFTDLSFAHEFYCAIKKRSMKCWLHFWTSFCAIWRCTCMNRNISSLHNHNSFFFFRFFFASNNKRGWREERKKLLKSRVWYESRKNSRTTHENTPQMFFSFLFFSFSISIKTNRELFMRKEKKWK